MKELIAVVQRWKKIDHKLPPRRIYKRRHKAVHCDCGGSLQDAPHALEPPALDSATACDHLRALYREHDGVQLTALGKQMFEWRWAARKLTGDTL